MLLTLTGTRLVDWRAFFVLVVGGATTSGTGKYEVVHDAWETGRRRLRWKRDMKIYCVILKIKRYVPFECWTVVSVNMKEGKIT